VTVHRIDKCYWEIRGKSCLEHLTIRLAIGYSKGKA